jgi:hypothetical protein
MDNDSPYCVKTQTRTALNLPEGDAFLKELRPLPKNVSGHIAIVRLGVAMKNKWFIAVVLAASISPTFARHAASDERDILKAEAALCHAFEVGDARYLRKALDKRFTLTSSTGVVTDLAQNLKEVTTREPAYDVFRNHDQTVRLYGDAAIITGITTVKGRSSGKAFAADFQYTDTWVRKGRWILAASHASRLPSS